MKLPIAALPEEGGVTVDDEADADVALVMGSEHAAPAGLVLIPGGNSVASF